jgi:hypothetical protein
MNGLVMGEPVQVHRSSEGRFPSEFTWRGRRHRIRSIETFRWIEPQRPMSGARAVRIRLRTSGGLRCWLSQDPVRGLWSMERVLDGSGG